MRERPGHPELKRRGKIREKGAGAWDVKMQGCRHAKSGRMGCCCNLYDINETSANVV